MPEIETVRRVITPQDCDILGHMNVSSYFDIVSHGGFTVQAEFGIDRDDMMNGRRLSFVVVHSESNYLAELLSGDRVVLRSGLIEIGTKSAVFRHRLFRVDDDKLCFETRFRVVLLHLDKRRAAPFTEDMLQQAQALLVTDDA